MLKEDELLKSQGTKPGKEALDQKSLSLPADQKRTIPYLLPALGLCPSL